MFLPRHQYVADRVCAEKGDCRRGGKDRNAREESGELRPDRNTGSQAGVIRTYRMVVRGMADFRAA